MTSDSVERKAAREINHRNRARNHVLLANNGEIADVMTDDELAAIIREQATGPLRDEIADLQRRLREFTPEDIRGMAYDANALLEQENKTLRELLERAVPHMKAYSRICKISSGNVQDWLARAAEVMKEGK